MNIRLHLLWLAACAGTWFAARFVYVSGDAEAGKEPAVSSRLRASHSAKPTEVAPGGSPKPKVTGKDTSSSSLPGDFEFPAEWDACECVRESLGELNQFRRMQMFQRAMQRLTPETAAKMQSVFSEYDKKGRWFIAEYGFFFRRWAEIDGKAAIEFVVNRGGNDSVGWNDYVRHTLTGWALNDPEGAVKWINDTPAESDWVARASVQGVIDALTEKDPARAISFTLLQAEDHNRDSYFSALTENLVYGPGLGRAEEWLGQIPETEAMRGSKQRVFAQIIDRHLRGGADGGAALVAKNANAPWVDAGTVTRVARDLSSDQAKFTAWLQALPPGPTRDQAASQAKKP